ncbi:trypsin-like serine protease [Kitasatospora griseola]|uniref:trypsin-like serine protease n=1 Tax=Kitasatospora griseola TaxID=2064 RepID=UPI0036DA6D27
MRYRVSGATVASAALAATVLTGLASTTPALADTPAGTSAPSAVEDGAYPGAAQILANKGITLTRGDGGITLADCTQPSSYQIKVFARTAIEDDGDTICFAAPGASGYLAFTIPDAYRITTYNRSVRASLSTDQKPTETTDVPANGTKGIGETLDPSTHAVLLELRVTGSTATPPAGQPADPATAFTAHLAIGDQGRACTGALVDPMWVLTAKSCFADDPANPATVTAGAPKATTTATVGRTDLNTTGGHQTKVVELVPHADRDLVMARLQTPITDIAPIALSATAAANGGALTAAGYGRTATDWTPGKLHTPAATTGAVSATGFDLAPTAPGLLCKGDAGAPLWRTENGKAALAGIVTRAWQGGCLGTDSAETRTGVTAVRADGLGIWLQQVVAAHPGSTLFAIGGDQRIWSAQGPYAASVWNGFTPVPGNSDMRQVSAVTMGTTQRLFAIAGDQRIWGADRNPATGTWGAFAPVPNNSGIKQVVAVPMGDKVRLFAIGSTGQIFTATGDYTAGTWSDFQPLNSSGIKEIAATAVGNTVRLFAIGSTDQIFTVTGDYTAGTWSNWQSVPGSAIQHIAVTSVGNTVRLFAIGSDKQTWATDNATGSWRDYTAVPATTGSVQLAATTLGDTVRLFTTDASGAARTTDLPNGGTWTASYTITSSALQGLAATQAG